MRSKRYQQFILFSTWESGKPCSLNIHTEIRLGRQVIM